MSHLRLNAKTTSPNPYFNFITALPSFLNAPGLPSQQNAKELLDALAAQVRPICKKHGFNVNSFEEYEHNSVFLGRNWNAGETIEIVLRHSDGTFHNIQQLIQVVCHELAHIKHMNHLAGFQQLNAQLCREVAALRAKDYYGDGMYSSGLRLSDSAEVAGRGLGATIFDLPEYMCGGAQQRQRASTLRRAPRQNGVRAQTTKRRKAGTRITSKYAFEGEGQALNTHIASEDQRKKGTGFRKSTQSNKERQARLEATEKRLKALQQSSSRDAASTEDSDSDEEVCEETDESRRKLLADAGAGWKFDSGGNLEQAAELDATDIIDLISDEGEAPSAGNSASATASSRLGAPQLTLARTKPEKGQSGLANMVRSELELRNREKLGLVGERRLGGASSGEGKSRLLGPTTQPDKREEREYIDNGDKAVPSSSASHSEGGSDLSEWACLVCTCLNHNDYGVCQACSIRRGVNTFLSA
ncbi:WLM-domain-containing protein [Ceratobasidium sp. AG-I]|nr:WLM-domain-containing protein [Ceratobasidium sp. AG-I]